LLKSKKNLLKFKDKGTKLVFDDDGNAHKIYELEDENDFRQRGAPEDQRARFLEEEAVRIREADLTDKQLAKDKKREKREKRKAKETAEREESDDEAPMLANTNDQEDPLALLSSLPLDEDEENDIRDKRPPKRPKKWFEDDSEEEKVSKRNRRVIESAAEPESLEDLEALAAGLLE